MDQLFPPSGPWSGYYFYGTGGPKHRMNLSLIFHPDGRISGEGSDDIAPFAIDGFFEVSRNEANWTKSYIGMHSVEYCGLYDQRTICGNWTLAIDSGGFWIWPGSLEGEEAEAAKIEEPIELTR
jgi:hypothetical protein